MLTLLGILISFVGTMLVLALAAQSLQEIAKAAFALKGRARQEALRGLLVQAAQACGRTEAEGKGLVEAVEARLRGLGQEGVRNRNLRLDRLTREDLASLIARADSTGLPAVAAIGSEPLLEIAKQAWDWFALAMAPIDERYRRRMRVWAVALSAVVVLSLNASALTILERARSDATFQAAMESQGEQLRPLLAAQRRLEARVAENHDPALVQPLADSLAAAGRAVDQATGVAVPVARSFLTGDVGGWRVTDPGWWIGIIISILLVSLGAPFWHDLLELLFGLKARMQAAATVQRENPNPDGASA